MARFANPGTYTIDGSEVFVAGGEGGADYCAFPGLVETAEDDLIVSYMRASDHATTRDGAIKAKRSTNAGATWGTEFTIVDDANDNRDSDLVRLASGRLVCSFTSWDGSKNSPFVTISDDHGTTWGTPIAVSHDITGTGSVTLPARVIQLPNGDCLAGVYGFDSGASLTSARVSKSTDECETWADLAEVRDGDTWGRTAGEPSLAYDPGLDRVWCSVRSDNVSQNRIYLFHSDDDGATWTTPSTASVFDATGKPATFRTREGALIITYRDSADSSKLKYRISIDNGATFGAAQTVNSTRKYEYASWWQRESPAKLALAWAVEFDAATNGDSRVYFQQFAEHHPLVSTDKRYPLVLGAP